MIELSKEAIATLFDSSVTKKDLKKLKILEAALTVITTSGAADLSFASIGSICKMDKGLVRYYFRTVDDIILQCLQLVVVSQQEYIVQRIKGISEISEDGEKACLTMLKEICIGFFCHAKEFPESIPLLHLVASMVHANKEISSTLQETRITGRKRIAALMEPMRLKLINKGVVEAVANSRFEYFIINVQSLISGWIVSICSEKKDLEEYLEESLRLLEEIFNGTFNNA